MREGAGRLVSDSRLWPQHSERLRTFASLEVLSKPSVTIRSSRGWFRQASQADNASNPLRLIASKMSRRRLQRLSEPTVARFAPLSECPLLAESGHSARRTASTLFEHRAIDVVQ